jgi:hypothetical protein
MTDNNNAIYYTKQIGIGTATPNPNTLLDVSGGSSLFSGVQERIQTAPSSFAANMTNTFNYAQGAIMLVPTTTSVTGNYTLNVTGLPPSFTGDMSKTYVISTINASSAIATLPSNTVIANSVTINGSVPISLLFNGGVSALPTTNGNLVIQQIAFVSLDGTVTVAISNVSQYKS